MAVPTVEPSSEPLSLEQKFAAENAELDAMLKAQGVAADDDLFATAGDSEKVLPPTTTTEDLDLAPAPEKPDPVVVEPAPEKQEPVTDPPADLPPVTDPPVVEPPLVAAEEDKKRKPQPWAEKRAAERRLADTQRELEELRRKNAEREAADKQAAADQLTDPEFDDPIEEIKKNQERIDGELKRQAEENRRRDIETQITRDEESFKQTNPDYREALSFVGERARKRFEVTGVLDDTADMIMEKHSDHIDQVMKLKGIVDPTVEDAENTARDIAFAIQFEEERVAFVQRAMRRGKSVAQAVYDLAVSEGYTKAEAAPAPAPAVDPPPVVNNKKPVTAQDRVTRAAKVELATQSLSAMQNAGKVKLEVRTKTEFMQLSPPEQDAFTARMELVNPDWLQTMPE